MKACCNQNSHPSAPLEPNRLIRQYLIKGTSMKGLTQQRCNIIAAKLNTRPRKRLGYKTPEECFNE